MYMNIYLKTNTRSVKHLHFCLFPPARKGEDVFLFERAVASCRNCPPKPKVPRSGAAMLCVINI